MREGARRLAGPHRRVDPALVEEALGDRGHLRREGAVGGEHALARLVPADGARLDLGQRRVAVPVVELVLAEPLGLDRVVAVRELGEAGAHGRDQRIHHLALDAVRQMPRVGHVLEAAPAVGDRLVLGERVGDEREQAEIVPQHLGDRVGAGAAAGLVGVLHQGQRLFEQELLAVDLEAQARHGLVEQPVPGAAAGDRLFVKQLLDAVLELVGLLFPHVLDPGPVVAEGRLAERLLDQRIVDAVELQREEQEMRRGRGDLVLHVAVELGALGVGGVAGMDQPGEGHEPAKQILDLLETGHRGAELGAGPRGRGDFGELALVGLLERGAFGLGAGEIGRHLRRIDAGIEIGKVPFRKRAERLGGTGGGRGRRSIHGFSLLSSYRVPAGPDQWPFPSPRLRGERVASVERSEMRAG